MQTASMPERLKIRMPEAEYLSIAPGRVNLLGEHVDYNGGAVLPAAIDRSVFIAAKRRSDQRIILDALDLNSRIEISIPELEKMQDISGHEIPGWALYPAGVAAILQRHGLEVKGIEATFTSDIPVGAGLSSSAAVEVAFGALWQEVAGWEMDRLSLAQICQEAENEVVGVNCGLMDQFASANGIKDHVLYFDTLTLKHQAIRLPDGVVLVIADSGIRHTLANSEYNERRKSCEAALEHLRRFTPQAQTLRDISLEEFNMSKDDLPAVVQKRAGYVINEFSRVEQARNALERGDAAAFGKLMFKTHAGLRDEYEVSCPELDCLVEIAARLPGCLGARLTGAGFGGCTINLVKEDDVNNFITSLRDGYTEKMGRTISVFPCHTSQGVQVVGL